MPDPRETGTTVLDRPTPAPRTAWWRPRRSRARRVIAVVLGLVVLGVVVMTLMRAIPYDTVSPIAQLVSVTPWVALVAVVLLPLVLLAREWVLAIVTGAAVLAHALWLAPFFLNHPVRDSEMVPVTVLTVNALYGRADAEQIVELVRDGEVDVLSIVELTPALVDRLDEAGLDELLPHALTVPSATGAGGSGLWSAVPLTEQSRGLGTTFAMPSAVVEIHGVDLRVTAVHPFPPGFDQVDVWAEELGVLGDHAAADPRPQILLGDFNATYDHASFRKVLGDRFHDATRSAGNGLNLSWPVDATLPPLVDLDHVVIDRGMEVEDVTSVTIENSDHKALLVTVAAPMS